MLARRPVGSNHPETNTGSAASNLSRMLQAAFPDELPLTGRETREAGRPLTRRTAGLGGLVTRKKDFIRVMGGLRGAAAEKKLEFPGNPGYPLFHIKQTDELGPRAWGCCGLSSVSPVPSYGLPVLPAQDSTTPE